MRFTRFIIWALIISGLVWGYRNLTTIIETVAVITHDAQQLTESSPQEPEVVQETTTSPQPPKQTPKDTVVQKPTALAQDTTTQPSEVVKQEQAQSTQSKANKIVKVPKITEMITHAKNKIVKTISNTNKTTPVAVATEQSAPIVKPKIIQNTQAEIINSNRPKPNNARRVQLAMYNKAIKSFDQGNLEQAKNEYHNLLKRFPNIATAWGELGDTYYLLNDSQNASKAYGNAFVLFKREGNMEVANRLMSYIEKNSPRIARRLRDFR